MIGWGNVSVRNGRIECTFGYVESQPRSRAFQRELDAEIDRLRVFLGVDA